MKKNYVSNSEESIRMFKSNFFEVFSKVHYSVPLFIYIPVIGFFIYLALASGAGLLSFVLFLSLGLAVWTVTEYTLHRYIFHYHPTSEFGKRIHFIFHGVHHDYPRDKKRLVMPPAASIPLATLFYFLFSLMLEKTHLYAFFPGFLLGYLVYDMMHYAMHHYNFKSGLMKRIKQHHMLHHYQNPDHGYGVTSAVWDKVFGSEFPGKRTEEPVENQLTSH